MPRSVQQSIPIDRIYADGVWQSGNVFSMMWQISDINYAMQSDAAKQNILTQLGTVYAGIPADCWMQVCIVSQRMDEKAFARDVLYHRENDGFDALRAERNRQIKANARENGNVVQHKYIIVSTNKPGVKEARERFVQVQGHLLSAFSALECAVTPLDNRTRLEVLHKFFRISEEGRFNFDFDNCAKLGQDFRDSIAPDCIRFCKKHIEIEDFYAKCMTISEYPQQLDDKFISALLQQVPYIVLPMTPPMPCWQTPNLWSCCDRPRTLTAWWSCTACPSRSENTCCWPSPVRALSKWATALSLSTTPSPRILRLTNYSRLNPVKWSESYE